MTLYEDLPPTIRIAKLLEEALSEVMPLLQQEFDAVGGVPIPESALDQAGLLDGPAIITELCNHREGELALEHICYMIHEPGLRISSRTYDCLEAAARIFGKAPEFPSRYGTERPTEV